MSDTFDHESDAYDEILRDKDLSQLNREVAEWLGLCWHEIEVDVDGSDLSCSCGDCGINADHFNPDFIQHPVELLRLMNKRADWPTFASYIGDTPDDCEWNIKVKYLLDQTGLLLRRVAEWKEKKCKR